MRKVPADEAPCTTMPCSGSTPVRRSRSARRTAALAGLGLERRGEEEMVDQEEGLQSANLREAVLLGCSVCHAVP